MGRYSHSKIDTFKTCPKKYDYNYRQKLEPIEDSIYLIVGKLFHSAMETISNFGDPTPYYNEFATLYYAGRLKNCKANTLEMVIDEYLKFYNEADKDNEIIFIEKKFEHLTDNADVISGMFDVVYSRHGLVYGRDYKTTINSLKYTLSDVQLNRQLNLYSYVLENDFDIINHYMEIDEVVIRELDQITFNKDGTPTMDKRKLAWVTYEAYYEALENLGLEDDSKYYGILKYLQERGHPLFRRITVPVNYTTRENIYEENLGIIEVIEKVKPYRVKSKLCDFCPFQELCNLELQGENDVMVEHLRKTRYKAKEETEELIEEE